MNTQLSASWYQRELEITFQFVVKCGFVSKPLLQKLFGIKSDRSLRRFAMMMDQSKLFYPLLNTPGFRGWHLSRVGKHLVRLQGLKPSYRPMISSRNHDEMALSIAIQLQKCGLVTEWSPESRYVVEPSNRLMVTQNTQGQKYPDLVLTVPTTTEPFRVAVELELNRKSLSRYEKALTGYKAVRGVDVLIFAVKSDYIRGSIETAIRRTRFDQNRLPIVFTDARAFYENPREMRLWSATWSGTFGDLATLKGNVRAA